MDSQVMVQVAYDFCNLRCKHLALSCPQPHTTASWMTMPWVLQSGARVTRRTWRRAKGTRWMTPAWPVIPLAAWKPQPVSHSSTRAMTLSCRHRKTRGLPPSCRFLLTRYLVFPFSREREKRSPLFCLAFELSIMLLWICRPSWPFIPSVALHYCWLHSLAYLYARVCTCIHVGVCVCLCIHLCMWVSEWMVNSNNSLEKTRISLIGGGEEWMLNSQHSEIASPT